MSNFLFDTIKVKKPKLNAFDLSFENRFSCEFGQLIPVMCKEVLPGDKFKIDHTALIRMAPMTSPVMSRIDVDIRTFFVPNRLVWDKWEDFITGGIDGTDISVLPYFTLSQGNYFTGSRTGPGSLADFLGVNVPNAVLSNNVNLSSLPFRAYTKIWNDWYRDELLDNEIDISFSISGSESITSVPYTDLLYRRYRKDYFTSARPNAQLGGPITVGMVGTAPVGVEDNLGNFAAFEADTNSAGTVTSLESGEADLSSAPVVADMSQASAVTIANLRRAFRLQEWAEKSIRGGNRYIENILVHFGVRSSDARLQRSQYLGGTSSPVVISDVVQGDASTASTTPIGTLAGKGTCVSSPKVINFTSEEHGFLISLLSIVPKVGYMQGMNRMFFRKDKFDFAWPEFALIGEQEIHPNEIYVGAGDVFDDGVIPFGYQSRYCEYKSSFDEVHGEFKTSLNSWVQNRNFASAPHLNSNFIGIENSVATLNQIFATQNVPGTNHFYCQVYNNVHALRPLPKYSTPSII